MNLKNICRMVFGWRPYKHLIDLKCDLCNSNNNLVIAKKMQFNMNYSTVICKDCGLIYSSPRPTDNYFLHFYQSLYPELYNKYSISSQSSYRGDRVAEFILKNINHKELSGIFDIGCGDCSLLISISKSVTQNKILDINIGGCDPGLPVKDKELLIKAENREILIYNESIERIYKKLNEFNVFIMYDV